MGYAKLSDGLIAAYRELDTGCISDGLDRLGIPGACHGLRPIAPGSVVVGTAFTVRYIPTGLTKGTVGDYIDDVEPGQVVVLDNLGRTDCTVWGNLLALAAQRRQVAGTIIDGACRDIPRLRELRYPVFARGQFMKTGKDRVQVDGINVTVSISGIPVRPGDLIVGDDSGVVVVPLEKIEPVLKAAREIYAAEQVIEQALLRGGRLTDARKQVGYHTLQTRIHDE